MWHGKNISNTIVNGLTIVEGKYVLRLILIMLICALFWLVLEAVLLMQCNSKVYFILKNGISMLHKY